MPKQEKKRHCTCSIFFLVFMSEGLVTPKRTTARFLPGSPRERYKAELAMVKDNKKKDQEEPKLSH